MHNLQIVMMKRYLSETDIERINYIAPDAKITFFDLKKRHPNISKIRAVFRRILPFYLYHLISGRLDELSDEQKLIWLNPPRKTPDINTVLLFPALIERNAAKELVSRTSPKWIHSIMTGIDRLPPTPGSTLITSSRGLHSKRIAEFVMSLIFAFSKNLPEHIDQNRKRIWKALPSKIVRGARLGIVGLGSIGIEIAKIAKIFGMEVWATKRKIKPLKFVDCMLSVDELPRMLKEVDYVVLAVPLTRETRNLIGETELSMMKKTACLINICRGAVVDENSLYNALKYNQIRGACIDIFKDEKPLPKNSRFYRLRNLLITSFSTYYSDDSKEQILNLFFKNLELFIVGKPLLSIARKSQIPQDTEAIT